MAIKPKEYLLSVNDFKEPSVIKDRDAVALSLIRLIMMEPGSNPLHPGMGVGIKKYRYGLTSLEELRKTVQYQINTYLPIYQNATVTLIRTPDKLLNIEMAIGNDVYTFDSSKMGVPISLTEINTP